MSQSCQRREPGWRRRTPGGAVRAGRPAVQGPVAKAEDRHSGTEGETVEPRRHSALGDQAGDYSLRTPAEAFGFQPYPGTSDSESLVGWIGKKNRFGFSVGMVHRFGFQIRHQHTLDWNRLAVNHDRPLRVYPSRHLLHDVHAE